MSYCLDAWAVIALLEDHAPAAARVDQILDERPVISWINVGEMYYILAKHRGTAEAEGVVRDLRPRVRLDLPSSPRVMEAARLKAKHRVSYADAFAIATAVAHGAVLATGDPEILRADLPCEVEDLG